MWSDLLVKGAFHLVCGWSCGVPGGRVLEWAKTHPLVGCHGSGSVKGGVTQAPDSEEHLL